MDNPTTSLDDTPFTQTNSQDSPEEDKEVTLGTPTF